MKRIALTQLIAAFLMFCCLHGESHAEAPMSAEGMVFELICPGNVYLSCGDDIYDLDQYGQAYVHGYGSPQPAPPPQVYYNLNSCGTGYIKRVWSVQDYGGYYHHCSQFIYITGGSFGPQNIIWPADYMTDECNGTLAPGHLPDSFGFPKFVNVHCGEPMYSYTDWEFLKEGAGCGKILRYWTVIDWCVHDPNAYYPIGIWKHTQVIKIKAMGEPEIDCPYEIVASTDLFSCENTEVDFPIVTATGVCGDDLMVKNDYPWATSGSDASGYYPVGTTIVTFKADDKCGNVGTCQTKVIVKDQIHPTPVCHHGISSTLKQHSDGYYLDLVPEWFNRNSFDNCTPNKDLILEVSPERVDCDDLDEVEVKLTVTDQSGNSNFCITYLRITDNKGLCPNNDSLTAGGTVTSSFSGQWLSDITLELKNGEEEVVAETTTEDGKFLFEGLPASDYFSLAPRSGDNPLNGISTMDLLLLHMYVAGLWSPDNALQLLAADVDMSGSIDVMDIAHLRNVILGRSDNFPGGDSWRFYSADHNFNNREKPHQDHLPGKIEIFDFEGDMEGINFSAVKLGDLTRSADSNLESGADPRSLSEQLLRVDSRQVGNVNALSIFPDKDLAIYGLQFNWPLGNDNELLDIQSDIFPESAIHYHVDEDNNLRISLAQSGLVELEAGEAVLEIVLAENPTAWSGKVMTNEIYTDLESPETLVFEPWIEMEEGAEVSELTVFPNPASGMLNIRTSGLDSDQKVHLEIFNMNGQLVKIQTFETETSEKDLQLNLESVPAGMYILKMSSGSVNETVRFVRTD